MQFRICFFGTPDYSLLVLERLYRAGFTIVCIVTKPPRPVGRKQILTPTPVAVWADAKKIPVLTPASDPDRPWLFTDEKTLAPQILQFQPELLVSADYTQKIPMNLVRQIKYGGLNVHPSLLPVYRGPAPVPWAIVMGESETGVSIITLSEKFDEGTVIAQAKEPILSNDTADSLLTKLFTKGGELLIKTLPQFINKKTIKQYNNRIIKPSYFPRLTRDHGFVPWKIIQAALNDTPVQPEWLVAWSIAKYFDQKYLILNSKFLILNCFRAFHPWPGVWTLVKIKDQRSKIKIEKRLKLLKLHLSLITSYLSAVLILDEIQLEGKQPVSGKDLQIMLKEFE